MTHIRPCTTQDLDLLRNLSIQCFSETFGTSNSQEDLEKYIQTAFSPSQLLSCIENPASTYFFYMEDHQPVGYLKLNESASQTELQDPTALEVERIYVLKSHHGVKVGQSLMNHAISTAKGRNKAYLFLGVWENNHRAIRFYEKNGFRVVDTHKFIIGTIEQTDYIMKKALID